MDSIVFNEISLNLILQFGLSYNTHLKSNVNVILRKCHCKTCWLIKIRIIMQTRFFLYLHSLSSIDEKSAKLKNHVGDVLPTNLCERRTIFWRDFAGSRCPPSADLVSRTGRINLDESAEIRVNREWFENSVVIFSYTIALT